MNCSQRNSVRFPLCDTNLYPDSRLPFSSASRWILHTSCLSLDVDFNSDFLGTVFDADTEARWGPRRARSSILNDLKLVAIPRSGTTSLIAKPRAMQAPAMSLLESCRFAGESTLVVEPSEDQLQRGPSRHLTDENAREPRWSCGVCSVVGRRNPSLDASRSAG